MSGWGWAGRHHDGRRCGFPSRWRWAFLAGQWTAWKQLAMQHATHGNPSSHFFYLITYAHAAHLLIGVAALTAALVGLHRSRRMLTRQILVDATVWYWHAMGVLWVFLFALLEFCQ
jgi:cytochrome c oxidase subunit 3